VKESVSILSESRSGRKRPREREMAISSDSIPEGESIVSARVNMSKMLLKFNESG